MRHFSYLTRIFHNNLLRKLRSRMATALDSRFDLDSMYSYGPASKRSSALPHQASQLSRYNQHAISGLAYLLAGALLFSSCASYDHRLNDPSLKYLGTDGSLTSESRLSLADQVSYWDGDNIAGAPSMVITLSEQRLYYYKGNKLVGVSAVSTGSEGRETKAGHYNINQKDLHHVSSSCGDYVNSKGEVVVKNIVTKECPMPPGTHFVGSPMPCFMRIYNGVGMHTGFLPGIPDSHGCIRLPDRMAKKFFEVTPIGTPVTVKR